MTAYTTRAKLEAYWSEYGVDVRLDDDADGEVSTAEEARLDVIISQESAFVGSWLSRRYAIESIGGVNPPTTTPESVSYMTSICVVYRLGRRRDNPVSDALEADYKMVREWLEAIANGQGGLVDLVETTNNLPFMSNFRVDGSFPRSVVRVVPATSTGGVPAASIRRASEYNWFYWS